MFNFGFPALTWAFLLALAPLLIHLINLLRHRRVQWAAMDFLLQSYKKHRKWVWLRQFLLLATRILALVLLVAMLAQWKPQHRWLSQFSGAAAHHYVLLDDSFSMSQRRGEATAFEQALSVVRAIAARAQEQDGLQRFTLVRFSRAAQGSDPAAGEDVAQLADLNAEIVDARFEDKFEEQRRRLTVSQLAAGPVPSLGLVKQLVAEDESPQKIVYVVSDFRAKEWRSPAEARSTLEQLEAAEVDIEFVSCVRQAEPNLAIVDLQPDAGPRAAGVPLFVSVAVKNFGSQAAQRVQLKVRSHFYDDGLNATAAAGEFGGAAEELPVELIESIPPGETVRQRVQVYFPEPGQHVVEAELPEDSVTVDNRRWCSITFRTGEPVLIVDGDPAQRNAFYMESIFNPGTRANTGIEPRVESATFLRDAAAGALDEFAAIYLLDVNRLDTRAVENLEKYVTAGGGLALFLGPQVDARFYSEQLYRNAAGLLPMPLEQQDLMPARQQNEPDINIEGTDHPVFRDLLVGRNPLIRLVHVDRYFSPPENWKPPQDSTVRIIAALRSGVPLAVEKAYGEGRVVMFTTTYAPLWNDLALGPNALVALQLQAYLSQGRRPPELRVVGSPLRIDLNTEQFQKELKFVAPGSGGDTRIVIDRTAQPADDSSIVASAVLGAARGDQVAGETDRAGVYEAWLTGLDRAIRVDRFAINVDPAESDLTLVESKPLVSSLAPVSLTWRNADETQFEALNPANLPPSLQLMALLVGLLLAEQALGYAASYHTSSQGGPRL